jgi:hypothetical protein
MAYAIQCYVKGCQTGVSCVTAVEETFETYSVGAAVSRWHSNNAMISHVTFLMVCLSVRDSRYDGTEVYVTFQQIVHET